MALAMNLALTLAILVFFASGSKALRFVIDRKECFSHPVEYDGDLVQVSFVVVKTDRTWAMEAAGVDLVVEAPGGYQVHDVRNKAEEKFEFVAPVKGLYKFCFVNLSPVHETIAFDVHVGHLASNEDHAKDDHIDPLMGQIARLEEALYSVSFEQHWLQAQTERQAVLNNTMSKRVIYKAVLESAALISASMLQVYLLRRLFEKRFSSSRV